MTFIPVAGIDCVWKTAAGISRFLCLFIVNCTESHRKENCLLKDDNKLGGEPALDFAVILPTFSYWLRCCWSPYTAALHR